jgi:hypothetical protein
MTFDELVAKMRKEFPGRVTTVSYAGLKFALECGIDIISDYAEMYTCQAVIRDCGTPAQKQRLKEELIASRWSTEIMLATPRV